MYTAEGQLRPKGNNHYCMDVAGGQAGRCKQVHIWDCDGGVSEKWSVRPWGGFANHTQSQAYCLDRTGGTYETHGCSEHPDQKFRLKAVADWRENF